MRCDQARKLLSSDQEPAEAVLEELFAHVDDCADCEALDASRAPVGPLAALSAPSFGEDFFAKVQGQLSECETAMAVINPEFNQESYSGSEAQEPEEELIASSFDHVDSCGPCREELDEETSPKPLVAYSQARSVPDLSAFADKVWSKVGACAATYAAFSAESLSADKEPSAAELSSVYQHIDACEPCAAFSHSERSPILAAYASSRQLPENFSETFYSQVEERLGLSKTGPMRIGAFSQNRGWAISGVVLAMAASFLVAMTLWQAFFNEDANKTQPFNIANKKGQDSDENLAQSSDSDSDAPLKLDDFDGLSDFVPGKRVFLQMEGEGSSESESFQNEVESPGEGFQFRYTPNRNPAKKRRAPKNKSSDTALSM